MMGSWFRILINKEMTKIVSHLILGVILFSQLRRKYSTPCCDLNTKGPFKEH